MVDTRVGRWAPFSFLGSRLGLAVGRSPLSCNFISGSKKSASASLIGCRSYSSSGLIIKKFMAGATGRLFDIFDGVPSWNARRSRGSVAVFPVLLALFWHLFGLD